MVTKASQNRKEKKNTIKINMRGGEGRAVEEEEEEEEGGKR